MKKLIRMLRARKIKIFYSLLLLFLIPPELFANESYSMCFLVKENNHDFYWEDGVVKFNGNKVGETKKGCFHYPKEQCDPDTKITFQINALRKFNYAIDLEADTCRNNSIYFDESSVQEVGRLLWSRPYVENIVYEDSFLKEYAERIADQCALNDKTCLTYNVYRHVVSNYSYILDPPNNGQDSIFTPTQTIRRGGGDCEDLTGLTNSLLENLNIDTYIALTEDHAYGLVCGVNPSRLNRLVLAGYETEDRQNYSQEIRPGNILYFSHAFDGNTDFQAEFEMKANSALKIYGVPSKTDFDNYVAGKKFRFYQNCTRNGADIRIDCQGQKYIGWIIANPSKQTVRMKAVSKLKYHKIDVSDIQIQYYELENQKCVVLEPTAGKDGYPGYSVDNSSVKIAINPRNLHWHYLGNR